VFRRVLIAALFALLATVGATAQVASADNAPAQAPSATATDLGGPCPYSGAHPTLRQGSSGEAVRHLQCLLNRVWGYGIAIDGAFGPATRGAVVAHQLDCGIAADGVVGPVTWSRLHPDTTTAACRD
jgi:zinc D-Ala-D-Ala carboxypeptidase